MSKFTLPKQLKKKYRKIVVNDTMYAWKVGESLPIGYGYGISILHVNSKTSIGGLIKHRANYLVSFDSNGKKSGTWVLSEEYKITPSYIRRVILYAIENGWVHTSNKTIDLHRNLPLSHHIEFNFPKLNSNQVVVIAYKRNEDNTLSVLNEDLERFVGKKSYYNTFSNQVEAESYMLNISVSNPQFEFWMTNSEEKAIGKTVLGKIQYFTRDV